MSEERSAICLVIDRLSAAYVGALGNTWIRTPAFDRLAAQSLVFDRAMIDSPALDALYTSFWTGTAAWHAKSAAEAVGEQSLAGWCRTRGIPTLLVTDDGNIAAHPLAGSFDEVVHLPHSKPLDQANDWQETQLAAFFAAAVELLDTRQPPALVWLHTSALGRIWDSPQSLRDQYAAEDDPPAAPLVEPPSLVVGSETDPDMLLGLRHAYAGEVSVLDHCLGMLLDTIDGGAWRNALVWLTSCRGYPLGEHGIVGSVREALYGELVRMPSCIRTPGRLKYGAHSQALVQPADYCATLWDWFSPTYAAGEREMRSGVSGYSLLDVASASAAPRALAVTWSPGGEIALATPAWYVRASAHGIGNERVLLALAETGQTVERRIELFAQPDDYFQVNEVSDRCREIVEEFHEILQSIETAKRGGPPEFELSDNLLHGIEGQSCG